MLFASTLCPTLRAEDALPADIQRVVEQRASAIAKIDKIYLQELEKLKVNYTKQGNLDMALKIVSLMPKKERLQIIRACLKNSSKHLLGCTFLLGSGRNSAWRDIQAV
jgi:flagellar motor switch protein FliG